MIEIDAKDIQPIIDNLSMFSDQVTSDDVLLSLAQKVKDSIYLRTMRNKDINGKSFKPYSKKYAETKGVSTAQVNLYSQNMGLHMLDSMAIRIISNDASEVYFNNREKEELAFKHNSGEGAKKRE